MWPEELRAHCSWRQSAVFPLQNPLKRIIWLLLVPSITQKKVESWWKEHTCLSTSGSTAGSECVFEHSDEGGKESPSLPDWEEREARKKVWHLWDLKKWIEFTILLIQYISSQWAVNPTFSLTWWSAAAGSGVDGWCNPILFLGNIYSVMATVAADCKLLLFGIRQHFTAFRRLGDK